MKNQNKPKKPMKDVDSARRTYFLRVIMLPMRWGILAIPLFIYQYGVVLGLLFWVMIILSIGIIIEMITDKIGDIAGRLYTGRKANWSIREQMTGTLSEVRVQRMKGNIDRAFMKIEEVLSKDRYFPEALLIKAQILYENYDDRFEALKCLDLAIEKTEKDLPVNKWAVKLKQEIVDDQKR